MNIFTFIKEHISILDVTQEYATLKQAGGYWKGHCPFHHEKTASFTVSPHKEIFYCFGCHVGGDVITFISKIENCSQLEAAKHLTDRYNLELPASLSAQTSAIATNERNHYFELCKYMAIWCHEQLQKNESLLNYIRMRGFDINHINYFTLGYFPGGLQSIKHFIDWMKQHNTLPHDLIEAHIISQGKTVLYSPFEERLIFPIKDHLGRFCGFGGRTFKLDDERPKYYNSRENDFFVKGSLLFGLDLAKEAIQKTDTAFLVEGYTDCMAMVQHGYPNTIATLGTACTAQHLKTLSRYAQKLYVLYDGDHAGQKAILRLTELCWQVSMELHVITLPAKDDPASYLLTHKSLGPLIGTSQNIFHFFLHTQGKEFTSLPLNKKVEKIREFLEIIQHIDDRLKQDMLLQKAAKIFDMPFESLLHELGRIHSRPLPALDQTEEIIGDDGKTLPILEKRLFCAILHNTEFCTNERMLAIIEYMPEPLRTILKKLQHAQSAEGKVHFTQFFDMLSDHEKEYVSGLLLERTASIDQIAFEQLVYQLQKKQWKVIVQDIKTRIAQAKQSGNKEQVKKLMQDFVHLQQQLIASSSK
ncbi:MAG TPA: DNA primase [Candidatus Dependentiae bacterium]|nr:DNA primase [Candidatus Dependentiae bacterium]HRQ62802.1 DNA primase [Candidatus Dependentiae bacterium]